MFVINCKNYEEISGEKIIQFVKTSREDFKKIQSKNCDCTSTTSNWASGK